MADARFRSMDRIRSLYPEVHEALLDAQSAINNLGQQGNLSPVGDTPPPPQHAALSVTGGGGYFRVNITPDGTAYRGAEHFVEVSEDPTFKNPHVVHLGASTSAYLNLGPKTLHFRSYSAYSTSAASDPVYAKNVSGAGGSAPAISSNQQPLQGYGANRYSTPVPPKRG